MDSPYLFAIILFVHLLFPVSYIFYRRGSNKLLFVGSALGVGIIVEMLGIVVIAPAWIVLTFFVPGFPPHSHSAVIGHVLGRILENPMTQLFEGLSLLIVIALVSVLIFRRYPNIFQPVAASQE